MPCIKALKLSCKAQRMPKCVRKNKSQKLFLSTRRLNTILLAKLSREDSKKVELQNHRDASKHLRVDVCFFKDFVNICTAACQLTSKPNNRVFFFVKTLSDFLTNVVFHFQYFKGCYNRVVFLEYAKE